MGTVCPVDTEAAVIYTLLRARLIYLGKSDALGSTLPLREIREKAKSNNWISTSANPAVKAYIPLLNKTG